MRITGVIAVPLMGALLVLAACANPAPTTTAPAATTPAPALATGPAVFITSNLTIRPYTVETLDKTEIGVTVTNTGGEGGTYTVVLKIDGAVTKTQDITLAGGTSRYVVFTVPLVSAFGNHVVTIDQLTGELEAPDPDAN